MLSKFTRPPESLLTDDKSNYPRYRNGKCHERRHIIPSEIRSSYALLNSTFTFLGPLQSFPCYYRLFIIFLFVFLLSHHSEEERKGWDLFRTKPPKDTTGSLASAATVKAFSKIAKIIAYIVTFLIFITGAVIAKGTLLFMTSQIKITDKKPDVQHGYCSTRN